MVFVHGFLSDGGTWHGAAARLQSRLDIGASTPSVPSRERYEVQADHLQQAVAPGPTVVAVAHSNGGLVSRQWSRHRPVSGIVTVGTPHRGSPLVTNAYDVAGYNGALMWSVNDMYRRFAQGCCGWQWILDASHGLWSWVATITTYSLPRVASAVALDQAAPVTAEMMPGSPFLSAINAPANLVREASAIPGRIGIVSTAYNFYWGGVLRAAFPDDGDTMYYMREVMRTGLDAYVAYVYANAPFEDWWAFEIADGMSQVSFYLRNMDEMWCRAVSTVGLTACYANDTVVPQWSQVYPGGAFIDTGWNGPAHTQETRMSDAYLERALTTYVGVRARTADPPPAVGGATFYGDIGFSGGSYVVSGDEAFVGWQWNDRISSVHVPPGRTVVLYEHADFGGASLELRGDETDLRDHPGPGLDGTWNDVVSAIRVR